MMEVHANQVGYLFERWLVTTGGFNMSLSSIIPVQVLAFLVGKWHGWVQAHHVVATECELLGKFFVGKKVYSCVKIEEKE